MDFNPFSGTIPDAKMYVSNLPYSLNVGLDCFNVKHNYLYAELVEGLVNTRRQISLSYLLYQNLHYDQCLCLDF